MVHKQHYWMLREHIDNLLRGLSRHKQDLPGDLYEQLCEDYYESALLKLESHRQQLVQREKDYEQAMRQFQHSYESIRKVWKKDVIRLKRGLKREEEKLEDFGIR